MALYAGMAVILAIIGWGRLARQVRGKVLQLRQMEYVVGARALSASPARVIGKYIVPNASSHIIVMATLYVPEYLLVESSLSFLGIGLTVDWTDPDGWIPERLSGGDRDLASAIWQSSGKSVNPRHTYGHWLLCRRYKLIDENRDGCLGLTEVGREFLHQERGDTEAFLDEREGVAKLLAMVADSGPTRAGGLLAEWSEYLIRYSRFGTQSTFRDTLRRRLNNLLDRELIAREGTMYSITDSGIDYLQRLRHDELRDGDEYGQLWALVKRQASSVRENLRAFLSSLDPFVFEHLVKRLLVEMDYQDVEVTTRSGDGGVDVVANIELGITRIREVIQAKRHKRTIQRKDLDALRGSLYRFDAVRGTIITTSKYSSGTAEAAFATGVAPITLIDGEKLIDLLVEYGIGVRKRTVEMLEFDRDAFSDLEVDG